MRCGVLRNAATGEVVAAEACLAAGLLGQLLGLIGLPSVPTDFALGLPGCSQIHTIGVRFPVDVAYCDASGVVLRVVTEIAPGRLAPRAPGAGMAWEMRGGGMAGRVRPGDQLTWERDAAKKTPPNRAGSVSK